MLAEVWLIVREGLWGAWTAASPSVETSGGPANYWRNYRCTSRGSGENQGGMGLNLGVRM